MERTVGISALSKSNNSLTLCTHSNLSINCQRDALQSSVCSISRDLEASNLMSYVFFYQYEVTCLFKNVHDTHF